MSDRQTGRTTQQMLEAPRGAVYVWCNSRMAYPRALADHIGRGDLHIMPLSWLCQRIALKPGLGGIVLDHAAQPDSEQLAALAYLRDRLNPPPMNEADAIVAQIRAIQRQHEAKLKPLMDRLVWLRSQEPPSQLMLMAAEIDRLEQAGARIAMSEMISEQPDGRLVFRRPASGRTG